MSREPRITYSMLGQTDRSLPLHEPFARLVGAFAQLVGLFARLDEAFAGLHRAFAPPAGLFQAPRDPWGSVDSLRRVLHFQ